MIKSDSSFRVMLAESINKSVLQRSSIVLHRRHICLQQALAIPFVLGDIRGNVLTAKISERAKLVGNPHYPTSKSARNHRIQGWHEYHVSDSRGVH